MKRKLYLTTHEERFIMNKLMNVLELNENDNLITATAKGMAEGAIKGAATWLTLAGTVYVIGKIVKVIEDTVEAKEDDGE